MGLRPPGWAGDYTPAHRREEDEVSRLMLVRTAGFEPARVALSPCRRGRTQRRPSRAPIRCTASISGSLAPLIS